MDAKRRVELFRLRAVAKSFITRMQTFNETDDRKLNDIQSGLMNCQIYITSLKLHRVN